MYVWSATRLHTAAVLWRESDAASSLTVVAKATFALAAGDATLAPVQEPIAESDAPGPSGALRTPSDLAPFKTRVDVVLVGKAYPARPGAPFRAALSIGSIAVGVDVGPGAGRHPLASLGPRPVSPARGLARWNVAPPDQQLDALPDEPQLTLENLSPLAPLLQVGLPPLHLSVYAEGGGITGSHAMRADTLWIDTDRQIACITYRARFTPEDDTELRATILSDHPSLQQEPTALALLELPDPDSAGDEEGELPIETGLVALPIGEPGLARDGLPFVPAGGAPSATPPWLSTPRPGGQRPSPAAGPGDDDPSTDDGTPETIPPPADDATIAPATIPPPATIAPATIPPPPSVAAAPPFIARSLPAPAAIPVVQQPPMQPPAMQAPAVQSLALQPPALQPPALQPRAAQPAAVSATPAPVRLVAPDPQRPALAHEAGGALAGIAGASDAALRATGVDGARRRKRGPLGTQRPRVVSDDVCDLVWFDPEVATRIAAVPAWDPAVRDHANDRAWLTSEESVEDARSARARRIVTRALARITPAELSTLPRLLAESFDEEGALARPLLLLAGELSLPFDPAALLTTTTQLADALAGTPEVPDKLGASEKLREVLKTAAELGRSHPTASVAEQIAVKIRQLVPQANRSLPREYLETTVTQTLLEERRHEVREAFGGNHVVAQIQPGSGTATTVYIPEEALPRLPVAARFRARLVVEPRPQEIDGEGPVVRALAIGRVFAQRPRSAG